MSDTQTSELVAEARRWGNPSDTSTPGNLIHRLADRIEALKVKVEAQQREIDEALMLAEGPSTLRGLAASYIEAVADAAALREMLREVEVWTRQVSEQPPERVVRGISSAAFGLHKRIVALLAAPAEESGFIWCPTCNADRPREHECDAPAQEKQP